MWTTSLLPRTVIANVLATAIALYLCLSRFHVRSASHCSSPINVGKLLYSSSNQHFNRYKSCLQLLAIQPSLKGLVISLRLAPMTARAWAKLGLFQPITVLVIAHELRRPWYRLVDRFLNPTATGYPEDQFF